MSRRGLRAFIVVGCLFGLAAAAWAGTQDIMPGDVVTNRQRLMKLNAASWADIQAKAKAGSIEAIAVNAETIAVNALHIPALFPPNSLSGESKAKPEIWQRFDEFRGAAKNLQERAERLRDAARAKDAATVEAMVKEFGPKACGTCHTPFRQPPRQ